MFYFYSIVSNLKNIDSFLIVFFNHSYYCFIQFIYLQTINVSFQEKPKYIVLSVKKNFLVKVFALITDISIKPVSNAQHVINHLQLVDSFPKIIHIIVFWTIKNCMEQNVPPAICMWKER